LLGKKIADFFFLQIMSLYLAHLLNRVLEKSFTMSFSETGEFFRVDSVRVEVKKNLRIIVGLARTGMAELTTQRSDATRKIQKAKHDPGTCRFKVDMYYDVFNYFLNADDWVQTHDLRVMAYLRLML
jgi:hypothetical protein